MIKAIIKAALQKHPASSFFILSFGISWASAFLFASRDLFAGHTISRFTGLLMFPFMIFGVAISRLKALTPASKKKLVKEFLDAFIFKSDLQKQLQG